MRILLFGITQFATKALKKLISDGFPPVALVTASFSTQDIQTMKLICKNNHIPVYQFADVNSPEFIKIVRDELQPHLLMTFTFPQKLSPELINIPKIAINMHPSLLPDYRGGNPYFWPIANGEDHSGISFHFLDNDWDTGDIIIQKKVPISPFDTSGLLVARQEVVAMELLDHLLKLIVAGDPLPQTKQPTGNFKLAPKTTITDTFINWHWPVHTILNRIRALNPYSGAYLRYKNIILAVYQATRSQYQSVADPGTIIALAESGPVVKASDGAVLLQILTVGKKYLLSGADFIEHEKVIVGDKFIPYEG
jgi:methionyl-tRNA formyltransferase